MALTAYRTRYTKSLDHPDILTTRQHFYSMLLVTHHLLIPLLTILIR